MKLVTFRADGGSRIGVVSRDDPHKVVEVAGPRDMLSLIDAGEEGLASLRQATLSGRGRVHDLGGIELLPPIPQPRGNVVWRVASQARRRSSPKPSRP